MNSTMGRVCTLGTLIFVGSILVGVDGALAANGPEKLLPTPAGQAIDRSSPVESVPAPVAEATAEDGATACDDAGLRRLLRHMQPSRSVLAAGRLPDVVDQRPVSCRRW